MRLLRQALLLAALCAGTTALRAQDTAATRARLRHGIGLHFGAYDFYGPQTSDYLAADRARFNFREEQNSYDTTFRKTSFWNPLVKASYWFSLSKRLDLNFGLSLASLEYPMGNPDSGYINRARFNMPDRREKFLAELDARIAFSLLSREDHDVSPYVFAGLNGSYHDIFYGLNIPVGVGVNIALDNHRALNLNLESAYKYAVTDRDENHLQHTVGFVYFFAPGYREPDPEPAYVAPPPPPDADRDGIVDSADRCPTIAGPAQFGGCPDSDGDGLGDKDDDCPLVAGTAAFRGCPDSDGDGIADNVDKCPYVAGTADRGGCPVPDADGDGFLDTEDRCPNQYSKTNNGCPEIRTEIINRVQQAAKAIFFETGKATLKKTSFKQLDAVVAILRDNPELFADIEGHTDAVGDDASNLDLSQRRAQAVVDYFVSKGVAADRLKSQGFGETQPVATNETAAGKAQNRRTEIKLRNYR